MIFHAWPSDTPGGRGPRGKGRAVLMEQVVWDARMHWLPHFGQAEKLESDRMCFPIYKSNCLPMYGLKTLESVACLRTINTNLANSPQTLEAIPHLFSIPPSFTPSPPPPPGRCLAPRGCRSPLRRSSAAAAGTTRAAAAAAAALAGERHVSAARGAGGRVAPWAVGWGW